MLLLLIERCSTSCCSLLLWKLQWPLQAARHRKPIWLQPRVQIIVVNHWDDVVQGVSCV